MSVFLDPEPMTSGPSSSAVGVTVAERSAYESSLAAPAVDADAVGHDHVASTDVVEDSFSEAV